MKKLPQRPRSHVLETESRIFVQQILPAEWIIREISSDYGIDLEVEIVDNDVVTGAHFLIQLKSTENLVTNKKGYISHSCKTSTLQYYLERSEEVIYLIYDSNGDIGYWVWIKDFLNKQPSQDWKSQEGLTIKIPSGNSFTKETVEVIKKRVFKHHAKEKIINRIQSFNSTDYQFKLSLEEDLTTVEVLPKQSNIQAQEATINLGLKFDNSPEGKKALSDWRNLFKKGFATSINARYIEKINAPFPFSPESVFGEDFVLTDLDIEPLKRGIKFPARIEILSENDLVIARQSYIEFEEVRHGTEEAEFSNDGQHLSLIFSMILNSSEKSTKLSCKTRLINQNVYDVKEAFTFQENFKKGHYVRIINLKTDKTFIKIPIQGARFSDAPEETINLASKLVYLQERFHVRLNWPQKITERDYSLIEDLMNILDTGRSLEGTSFEFPLPKKEVMILANKIINEGMSQFMLVGRDDRVLELLGVQINLGKIRVILPRIKPTYETIKKFDAIDSLPDDQPVLIAFEVSNPGTIIEYINWMPKTKGENNA